MSYLTKFAARMGIANSNSPKKRKIDECTSNSSLSNLRYVITEKPKWKVFRKRELVPIPAYQTSLKACKGCPCGSSGPCKQKITPRGVTIHYPQKNLREQTMMYLKNTAKFGRDVITSSQGIVKATKKTFSSLSSKKNTKQNPRFNTASPKGSNRVKTIKPKKYPTWRLDKISYGHKIITPRTFAQ